jgi:hypothetical protein
MAPAGSHKTNLPMPQRTLVVLFTFASVAALAAGDATPARVSARGDDDSAPGRRRPARAQMASFRAQPTLSRRAGSPGVPIDRGPIPAYPQVEAGPRQTIAGQCFVVTDGGHVIKLDQVSVSVYPQREFTWYAQEVEARSRARFERVKAVACPANFAALSVPEMDRSLAVAAELQRDLHVVWQALPPAAASNRTDAAGHFSVTHNVAPPYVVFAAGSRDVGGETEYYRWQIASSAIGDPRQIELSNDTLR